MADQNDQTQDVSIHNDATDVAVTTTTDGAKERLDCNMDGSQVVVTSDESLTKFQLKTDYDAIGVALNTSTDITLYTYTGAGVIDLIAVNSATSSAWEVTIIIDGTERIRITMTDLGSALGLTNSDFDIVAETANKQFRYRPRSIGFTAGFTVKAKAVTATPTVRHMVLFRDKTG